jgi:hypothetical protein
MSDVQTVLLTRSPETERVVDVRRLVRPLHVGSVGRDVLIAPGTASGPGWWYENDAMKRIPLPHVGVSTGVRVVLRVDWTEQQVFALALLATVGTQAPPPLVRLPGEVWDHPLASGVLGADDTLFLVMDPDAERVVV